MCIYVYQDYAGIVLSVQDAKSWREARYSYEDADPQAPPACGSSFSGHAKPTGCTVGDAAGHWRQVSIPHPARRGHCDVEHTDHGGLSCEGDRPSISRHIRPNLLRRGAAMTAAPRTPTAARPRTHRPAVQATPRQVKFYRLIYGEARGYVEICQSEGPPDATPKPKVSRVCWATYSPETVDELAAKVATIAANGRDTYVSWAVYSRKERNKAYALPGPSIFVDDAPDGEYSFTVLTGARRPRVPLTGTGLAAAPRCSVAAFLLQSLRHAGRRTLAWC